MYTIPKNIEELSNGEILTVFFENMKVPKNELLSVTGLGEKLATKPIRITSLSEIGVLPLVELKTLIMKYLFQSGYADACLNPEEDICLNYGKSMIILIDNELKSRVEGCTCGFARIRGE